MTKRNSGFILCTACKEQVTKLKKEDSLKCGCETLFKGEINDLHRKWVWEKTR